LAPSLDAHLHSSVSEVHSLSDQLMEISLTVVGIMCRCEWVIWENFDT
jgi:hypothetical protein